MLNKGSAAERMKTTPDQGGQRSRSAHCYSIQCRHWWILVGLLWLMVLAVFGSGTAFGYRIQAAQSAAECLTVVGDEPAGEQAETAVEESSLSATEPDSAAAVQSVYYYLRERDTLYEALSQFGVPGGLIQEWERAAQGLYRLSRVHPGQSFELRYIAPDQFQAFIFHISSRSHLVITRTRQGWEADLKTVEPAPADKPPLIPVRFHYENGVPVIDDLFGESVPADDQPHAVVSSSPAFSHTLPTGEQVLAGRVITSFYEAGIRAGLSAGMIMSLLEIFTWEIDFRRDFRPGDRFAVLVSAQSERKDGRGERRIVAAWIETGRREHWAFYYRDGKRPAGYYDEDGNSLGRFFLKSPIPGARVSSGYTHSRFHPLLHFFRPHLAVDYAAPAGTPIRAPADGVVEYAGWKGDYGRYLSLRHNATYTTTYGHLSRFGPGIRTGVRVKQGQIIGYVGSSGLATGPHLCYRILKHGKSVNPLKFRGSAEPPVSNRREFQSVKSQYQAKLADAQAGTPAAALARETGN